MEQNYDSKQLRNKKERVLPNAFNRYFSLSAPYTQWIYLFVQCDTTLQHFFQNLRNQLVPVILE